MILFAGLWNDWIENPTPVYIIAGLTAAFLAAGFLISRRKAWLLALIPTVLTAAAFGWADYVIISPREKVRAAIDACVLAVEKNEKAELMRYVAPELRKKVQTQVDWVFSLAEFTDAYANSVKLEVNDFTTPPTIRATFFAGVRFNPRKGYAPMDRYACIMTLVFEEFDGEWLITSHEERKPIGQ